MIAGMVPMALALGEGGEQTAPLGRAVIGGLLAATFATLLVLPAVFAVVHGAQQHRLRLARPRRPGKPVLHPGPVQRRGRVATSGTAGAPGNGFDNAPPGGRRLNHHSQNRGESWQFRCGSFRCCRWPRSSRPPVAVPGRANRRPPRPRPAPQPQPSPSSSRSGSPSSSPSASRGRSRPSRRRRCCPRFPATSRPGTSTSGPTSRRATSWPTCGCRRWRWN